MSPKSYQWGNIKRMNRNALTKKQIKKMSVDEYIDYLFRD